MRLAILRCGGCDSVERKLYLHHGRLLCAMCMVPAKDEDMTVRVRICLLRAETVCDEAEAVRDEAKRVRGKQGQNAR